MTDDRENACRVVAYADGHRQDVCRLARELWSADPRLNDAYFDWKYCRNPYIGEPLLYIAFDGDSLVGMRGVAGSCWETGEGCFTLPYADDLVVAPAYRGRWLHQRIMAVALRDLAARGHRLVVNLSASRATAVGSLKMRWRSTGGVGPLRRRTRRKTTVDVLEQRTRRLPFFWRWAEVIPAACLPGEATTFERLGQRVLSTRFPGIALESAPRTAAMAELVRRLPYDGRIRHLRDEAYLEWRYANPLRSYRFLYAGGTRLDGYLVLQRSLGLDRGRVSIVDWEASAEGVRRELLSAAIAGDFPELYAWGAACAPAGTELLRGAGFVPPTAEYEKSILVRPVRDAELKEPCEIGGRRLDDGEDWDLRMIYSFAS